MPYLIYLIVIVSFIDMFSQLPIMSPLAKDLGSTSALIGVIVGMYSFTNMIGNILSGLFIDKNGAKKVIVIGLLLTGVIVSLYPFVTSPESLLVVRFLHGLCGGLLVPAAFTLLSYSSNTNNQGKSMAVSGAAVGISAIVGPAFGGIVANKFGYSWVFFPITILMLIVAVLAFLFLKGPEKQMMSTKKDHSSSKFDVLQLLKTPMLLIAYLGAFSLMFAQGVLAFLLPLKVDDLQYGSQFSGLLLSTFGMVAILIFILPTNRLFDRFRHEKVMVLGMFIISFALIGLSFIDNLLLLFIVMSVYGLGFACLFPSINALIITNSSSETRGKAFGLFYAFFSVGVVFGSSVTGVITDSFSTGFLVGAGFLIVVTSSIVILRRNMDSRKRGTY
ncbi:MFS transporter [Bacillus sp. 31A1R]|uniref:MFS transporter n=1 Tax=Robertmurraya mangrovi TaxID=3098077 RepID=A0ABU5J1G5_9BACI|nr:MFS transporter [Bacillus sp. 31A1R]MDZ5473200.1 MFS transporter [Bacillus sp. 31A1R]